jgi:Na+/proline symporter
MSLEQWTVGGRGFGLILAWLLMAGEVYTTFAFLGASGWAYSRRGPTLYVMTAIAMYFAIFSSTTLVGLLLFAYSGVTQFFPGVVLRLFWKRATAAGAAAGIVTGVGVGMALVFSQHDPYLGLNAGFIALCLNAAVTVVVSLATPSHANGFAQPAESAVGTEAAN